MEPKEPPQKQKSSGIFRRVWGWKLPGAVLVLVAVLLLAAGCFFFYRTQQLSSDVKTQKQQAESLRGSLRTLDSAASKLESDKQALEQENQSLKDQLGNGEEEPAPAPVQDLRLKFYEAGINCCARGSGLDYVEVTVSLTNPNSKTVHLDMSDFSLRDPDNGVIYVDFNSGIDLTTGKVRLLSTDVEPGETVKGTIGFRVPVDIVDLKIKYKSQSISFEVSN